MSEEELRVTRDLAYEESYVARWRDAFWGGRRNDLRPADAARAAAPIAAELQADRAEAADLRNEGPVELVVGDPARNR